MEPLQPHINEYSSVMATQSEVLTHIKSGKFVDPSILEPLWAALPGTTVSHAKGIYHGGLFDGRSKPSPINWFGKQIISENVVNPLLCHPPNKDKNVIFPYPRPSIAQAKNVEHMGVTSVTIIYNKVPLMDYFRVVEDGEEGLLLLGKSDWAGHPADPAYFWLRRVEEKEITMDFENPYPNTIGW